MKNAQLPTFDQITDFLEENSNTNFADMGQYHSIMAEDILGFIETYFDDTELFNINNEKFAEQVSEWANSTTPVYHFELTEWFAKNWTAIDEYFENFGYSENVEIIDIIQATHSWTLENAMMTALYNLDKEY